VLPAKLRMPPCRKVSELACVGTAVCAKCLSQLMLHCYPVTLLLAADPRLPTYTRVFKHVVSRSALAGVAVHCLLWRAPLNPSVASSSSSSFASDAELRPFVPAKSLCVLLYNAIGHSRLQWGHILAFVQQQQGEKSRTECANGWLNWALC
jgi:hypothetical protein